MELKGKGITGSNDNSAKVGDLGDLMFDRMKLVSRLQGNAFSWCSGTYDYDAGDTFLYVQNAKQDKKLYIDKVIISSDTATQAIVFLDRSKPTLAGTAVSGTCLNDLQNTDDFANAYRDETGNSGGSNVGDIFVPASQGKTIDYHGTLILGYLSGIGVDFVTAGTGGSVTILGYFDD